MSLTSIRSDASAIQQSIVDSRNQYAYQADPIANFRNYPGPQGAGISVDRQGNGQAFVDAESLLRNQSFISSHNPQYRAQADACFLPYMQNNQPLPCAQVDLTPRVDYHSRACDPLSGVTIDRFDPVPQGAGFQYGYAPAQFGVDTRAAAKAALERNQTF